MPAISLNFLQFVLTKVLLNLFYLERMLALDAEPDASLPFFARFRNRKWLGGIIVFVLGVPCASESAMRSGPDLTELLPVLLGFSREFELVSRGDRVVGCQVSLKSGLATPIIGERVELARSLPTSVQSGAASSASTS
jgi:hypothetical protein